MGIVEQGFVFRPPRREGIIFHTIIILIVVAVALWALFQAGEAPFGPRFTVFMLPVLAAFVLVPYLVYRLYALYRAYYWLGRDGLSIQWGLRSVDVPMDAILWASQAADVEGPLPFPRLRWPGAVLGVRQQPEGHESVEFLAAQTREMIAVGTMERIYIITPADPEAFFETFRTYAEMGSVVSLPSRSVYPSFLLSNVWNNRIARYLILGGLLVTLLLWLVVSLIVPGRAELALGFDPAGAPREYIPAVRLFLLPVVGAIFFLVDFLLGLFFYRMNESRALSYLLWGSGVLAPFFFLVGVFFIAFLT